MVNYCVCAGCSNSSLSGHRVHRFPDRRRDGACFVAWLRFVQVSRRDFMAASVTKNAVVCGAHFRDQDYVPGDLMQFRMGCKSQKCVRLLAGAVPTVHAASGVPPAGRHAQTDLRAMSCEQLQVRSGAGGKSTASSVTPGNGNWDTAAGMDQITVVRIDDTHIAGGQLHVGGKVKGDVLEYHEVEYSVPAEDEVAVEEEEAEDGIYVIEYSNPEEEGESYKFTMSVDQKPAAKKPSVRQNADVPAPFRLQRPRRDVKRKRKIYEEEEEEEEEEDQKERLVSNKSVLELGEDYSDVMQVNSGSGKKLLCTMCPPPGRFFKRPSGLAVHLKHAHNLDGNKTYFCTTCDQTLRSQIELDTHTKRHANQDAVFTCCLCSADGEDAAGSGGYRGSKWGLKRHLEKEHRGVIPRCDICNKDFRSISSYLADQFRHVGVSPYYCARCRIYEMTKRGLSVHIKNHDKKKTRNKDSASGTSGVPANAERSDTDNSDF